MIDHGGVIGARDQRAQEQPREVVSRDESLIGEIPIWIEIPSVEAERLSRIEFTPRLTVPLLRGSPSFSVDAGRIHPPPDAWIAEGDEFEAD